MKIQFLLLIAIFLGANFYVFYRFWTVFPPGAPGKVLLSIVWLLLTVSPFLSVFAGNYFSYPVTSVLYKTGTAWLIIFLYLFMALLLWDLLHLIRLFPSPNGNRPGMLILCVLLLFVFVAGYIRYTKKERVELDIPVTRPASRSDSLKIVAVSDLHLGYGIGKKEFEKWIALINREEPDIVLMAGDIIDNSITPLYKQDIAASFGKIRSRYGVFAVPGNHEYIAGITGSAAFLNSTGITLLRDSAALVDGRFYVAGRDDRTNRRRKPLSELVAGLDRRLPVILLDHQPDHLEQAPENGIDLQISGHTHRGQIWPVSKITDRLFEKSHGYLRKGNSHIYVSSGLGIWGGKFRIGTRSEYVVIRLKIPQKANAAHPDPAAAAREQITAVREQITASAKK